MQDQATIRTLSIEDCSSVAQIHCAAFPDSSLTRLGKEAVRRYYVQHMQETSGCLAIGTFLGEVMTGFLFGGVFHGVLNKFLRANRLFLTSRVLVHPWLAFDPLFRDAIRLALQRLTIKPTKGNHQKKEQPFVVLSIAVDPSSQKSGFGKMLIQYAEQEAREHGFKSMSLTVNQDNCAAIRFYEKNGWHKREGTYSRYVKMVKPLQTAGSGMASPVDKPILATGTR